MNCYIDIPPIKECRNIDSYNLICILCNQCGRFTKDKKICPICLKEIKRPKHKNQKYHKSCRGKVHLYINKIYEEKQE